MEICLANTCVQDIPTCGDLYCDAELGEDTTTCCVDCHGCAENTFCGCSGAFNCIPEERACVPFGFSLGVSATELTVLLGRTGYLNLEVENTAAASDTYNIAIIPDEELGVETSLFSNIALAQSETYPMEYSFVVDESVEGGEYEIEIEALSLGSGKTRSATITLFVEAPVCGDGTCQMGEYSSNCCEDCGCAQEGEFCLLANSTIEGLFTCDTYEVCGDAVCEANKGESDQSCCFDCPCSGGTVCQSGICKKPLPVLVKDVDRMVTPNDEFEISVWVEDGYTLSYNDRPEGFRDCIDIIKEEPDDELNAIGLFGGKGSFVKLSAYVNLTKLEEETGFYEKGNDTCYILIEMDGPQDNQVVLPVKIPVVYPNFRIKSPRPEFVKGSKYHHPFDADVRRFAIELISEEKVSAVDGVTRWLFPEEQILSKAAKAVSLRLAQAFSVVDCSNDYRDKRLGDREVLANYRQQQSGGQYWASNYHSCPDLSTSVLRSFGIPARGVYGFSYDKDLNEDEPERLAFTEAYLYPEEPSGKPYWFKNAYWFAVDAFEPGRFESPMLNDRINRAVACIKPNCFEGFSEYADNETKNAYFTYDNITYENATRNLYDRTWYYTDLEVIDGVPSKRVVDKVWDLLPKYELLRDTMGCYHLLNQILLDAKAIFPRSAEDAGELASLAFTHVCYKEGYSTSPDEEGKFYVNFRDGKNVGANAKNGVINKVDYVINPDLDKVLTMARPEPFEYYDMTESYPINTEVYLEDADFVTTYHLVGVALFAIVGVVFYDVVSEIRDRTVLKPEIPAKNLLNEMFSTKHSKGNKGDDVFVIIMDNGFQNVVTCDTNQPCNGDDPDCQQPTSCSVSGFIQETYSLESTFDYRKQVLNCLNPTGWAKYDVRDSENDRIYTPFLTKPKVSHGTKIFQIVSNIAPKANYLLMKVGSNPTDEIVSNCIDLAISKINAFVKYDTVILVLPIALKDQNEYLEISNPHNLNGVNKNIHDTSRKIYCASQKSLSGLTKHVLTITSYGYSDDEKTCDDETKNWIMGVPNEAPGIISVRAATNKRFDSDSNKIYLTHPNNFVYQPCLEFTEIEDYYSKGSTEYCVSRNRPDIVAPGEFGTTINDYNEASAWASAVVSGLAALTVRKYTKNDATYIRNAILDTASNGALKVIGKKAYVSVPSRHSDHLKGGCGYFNIEHTLKYKDLLSSLDDSQPDLTHCSDSFTIACTGNQNEPLLNPYRPEISCS